MVWKISLLHKITFNLGTHVEDLFCLILEEPLLTKVPLSHSKKETSTHQTIIYK